LKNEEHAGNRSSDWFTCNKDDVHVFHLERKEDYHQTSKLTWTRCTIQPCPLRAYQPGKIPRGFEEPSNENQELIEPIPEFELGPSDGEEESTEGARTESTEEPEEPAPDQEEQDLEEERLRQIQAKKLRELEIQQAMADQEKMTQMARELETLKAAIEALTKGKNTESSSTSTSTESSKELCINLPKPFTGDRSQFSNFINALDVYFAINEGAYNSDTRKVGFALSFLEGNASSWKTAFIQSHTTDGTLNLGDYADFLTAIKKDFEEVDKKGDAIYKLQRLKQGNRHAEELVSEFRVLAHHADLISRPSPGASSSTRST
jgi:hypothetical protein